MPHLLRFSLLALTLIGYSSCCCCGDFSPSSSARQRQKGPRKSPMASARQLPPQSADAITVLWQATTPVQSVPVASLSAPATDERSALRVLKQQAAKLGANALTQLRVSGGIMSCEAVLITP